AGFILLPACRDNFFHYPTHFLDEIPLTPHFAQFTLARAFRWSVRPLAALDKRVNGSCGAGQRLTRIAERYQLRIPSTEEETWQPVASWPRSVFWLWFRRFGSAARPAQISSPIAHRIRGVIRAGEATWAWISM